jgi:hypothetical protein
VPCCLKSRGSESDGVNSSRLSATECDLANRTQTQTWPAELGDTCSVRMRRVPLPHLFRAPLRHDTRRFSPSRAISATSCGSASLGAIAILRVAKILRKLGGPCRLGSYRAAHLGPTGSVRGCSAADFHTGVRGLGSAWSHQCCARLRL